MANPFKPLAIEIVGSFVGGLRRFPSVSISGEVQASPSGYLTQIGAFSSPTLDSLASADNYDRTPLNAYGEMVVILAGDPSVELQSGLSTNYGEPDQGVHGDTGNDGGGGPGGPVDAADVSYDNSGYPLLASVKDALDQLLYIAPAIQSFTGGSQNEIGSTVHGVHLAWSINKTITSQSIDQSIGSLPAADRSYDYAPDITSNKTFTLTISDGTQTKTAQTTVSFLTKRYWGASASASLDNAAVLALSQELSASKSKSVTYNATGGKYPYFVYPKSLGVLSAVTVGGLAFTDFTQTTLSLTNASGHTEDYYVTRFNNIQTGAAINVVWG